MAFEIGTASGSIDLWDKLISFLTTDADLVLANAEWTVVWTAPAGQAAGIVLRGKGSSGSDSIYVGLARIDSVDTDANCIRIFGMTGVLSDAPSIEQHIGVSPEVRIWLDAGVMKYWFVANARRIAVVANMSTVYQAAYAGLFLPYASPLAYPYPMYVGGTSTAWTGTNAVTSWRSQSPLHAHFCLSPRNNTSGSVTEPYRSTGNMLDPQGAWRPIGVEGNGFQVTMAPVYFERFDADGINRWDSYNFAENSPNRYGSKSVWERITQYYGGGLSLDRFSLIQNAPSVQTYGVLDGVFYSPGVGNSAENTVNVGGVDHLIVQNVWRTGTGDYWALALE